MEIAVRGRKPQHKHQQKLGSGEYHITRLVYGVTKVQPHIRLRCSKEQSEDVFVENRVIVTTLEER